MRYKEGIMKDRMNEILYLLRDIHRYTQIFASKQDPVSLEDKKLRTKQEVMDLLKMSESTYKRNIKAGLLTPMKINGFDLYFEEDLLEAMEESRRKGRY